MEFMIILDAIFSVMTGILAGNAFDGVTEENLVVPFEMHFGMLLLVTGCVYLVLHLLMGMGLYTLAAKRSIKQKWLAFIPVANLYLIGVLAVEGFFFGKRLKGTTVAWIAIAVELLTIAIYAAYYVIIGILSPYACFVKEGTSIMFTFRFDEALTHLTVLSRVGYVLSRIMWLSKIVYMLFAFMNVMGLFRRYSARNSVTFSFLCVLFPIRGAFIYAIRKNKEIPYDVYIQRQRAAIYARQQEMMQAQMRNNPYYNNPYNNPNGNPYNNNPYNNPNGNPYNNNPYNNPNGNSPDPTENANGGQNASDAEKKDDDDLFN